MLDLPQLTFLYKTFKAAKQAIVDKIVLNYTNIEFLVANIQKKNNKLNILDFNTIVKMLIF